VALSLCEAPLGVFFWWEVLSMANPQKENGHIGIANEIAEALMKINLSPYESRVLWFLFRKTYGWNKKDDWISLSQFSKCIGIDRRLVHRALKQLSSKEMIVINKDDSYHITYGFQKDYEKWKVSSKKMTVISRDDGVSSKQMTKLSSVEIPTKDTIQKTLLQKTYTASFLAFWDAYPKKRGKPKSFVEWKKKNPHLETVLDAIEKQKTWRDSAGPKDFRPEWKDPERWIKGEHWTDEVEEDDGWARLEARAKLKMEEENEST
jgi:phage replication O-like protein O